ncbi:MAG TPA: hypothetical protein VGP11_02500 [Acidimicrobiales bacterium]|jgi:hypothetical protein|nr:hypothetical protein [Acidimicrobiales bacterium]
MPSHDLALAAPLLVYSVTPKEAAPWRAHLSAKFPVADSGRPATPVPSTMGSIWLRVSSAGKMATLALTVALAGLSETTVVNLDVPRLDKEVSAF